MFIFVVFFSFLVHFFSSSEGLLQEHFPIGDLRNCPSFAPQDDSNALYAMDALPGMGFDVLRDIDMGQVLNYNYSLCQISKDGKYIVPDDFYLIPTKQSVIKEFAEYFDHWDNYTSLTSHTVSAYASVGFLFASIHTSFSSGFTEMKSHMVKEDSSVTRIHMRSKLYTVHAQPRASLHPDFKSRLLEIAAYLEKNISSTDHIHYLAELLVRDYGTHYLTSVDVGAIIGQTDYIRNTYTKSTSSDAAHVSIKASASASFFVKVSVGGGFSSNKSHTQDTGYMNNRTYSTTYTIGGALYRPNMTVDQWEDTIPDNLVIIDRAGAPLHFIINSNTVPELRHKTRVAVADVVYEAVKRYFKVNTHKGCTDPKRQSFDFRANVDDGCFFNPLKIKSNYTFGGFYLQCPSSNQGGVHEPNPLTRADTCPDSYSAVKFFDGQIYTNNWWWHNNDYMCQYDAYWCVPEPQSDIPVENGLLFGGYYSTTTPNLLTNTMGCPPYFIPLKIGNYLSVCVSTDYEHGYQYSIPFGGFETCQSGNPIAAGTFTNDPYLWPHECPQGYKKYFGSIEHGCEINLCIKKGVYKSISYDQLSPPRLPPFHVHEPVELNDTESLSFIGSDGNEWTRNWLGVWTRDDSSSQCYETVSTTEQEMHTVQTRASVYTTPDKKTTAPASQPETITTTPDSEPLKGGDNKPSTVAIALPTVLFSVLVVVCVVAMIAFLTRRYYKRRRGYSNMQLTQDQLSDQNTTI